MFTTSTKCSKPFSVFNLNSEQLDALLFPTEGAEMYTILTKGAVKTVAKILLAPGGGLPHRLRELAISGHDHVHVSIRGDVYRVGGRAPSPNEFDSSTLRWTIKRSRQIAVWSAPFPEFYDDIGKWLCDEALAGSSFQTVIETVPSHAAKWRELISRRKGPHTELRFFGPQGVQ